MDVSYIYWFTRIGAIESVLSLFTALSFIYLLCYALIKGISSIDDDALPKNLNRFFTTKMAIISTVAFFFLMIAIEMVPSKQDLQMMLAVKLATEHGIKIQIEK